MAGYSPSKRSPVFVTTPVPAGLADRLEQTGVKIVDVDAQLCKLESFTDLASNTSTLIS
ncbi:hypothetical protein GGS23DRAFT_257303 [Durotheca rogersii]|uniref:uncharacterized protein n=1 Tax=Durotheca rogersii TaxID=419775 RepID=UPI00221FE1F6|nr:uncharacterized protein GGS23DRAFT_257303 [Durotheca rogersii]KAI5859980.1 hypothetical protein GGS23DRAFT_257303 [Durotheca rogersii]